MEVPGLGRAKATIEAVLSVTTPEDGVSPSSPATVTRKIEVTEDGKVSATPSTPVV